MNNIATALVYNSTIMHNKTATINGGQIGVEAFGVWKSAMENAHKSFYKYECAIISASINPEKSAKESTAEAMNSLQAILDLVGEVNGHAIVKSADLLNVLAKHSIVAKKERTGNAMLIASQLKNYRQELRNAPNGSSEEYITSLEKNILAKEEELRIADKQAESASKYNSRTNFSRFCTNFEAELAKVVKGQEAKSWEELEAEEQARKEARKARHKAQRQANKAKTAA